jgi:hypothetical protein
MGVGDEPGNVSHRGSASAIVRVWSDKQQQHNGRDLYALEYNQAVLWQSVAVGDGHSSQ